jgi:hypothetical protein
MKSISTFPTFSLAAVSFAGMALFAVIDQAEASCEGQRVLCLKACHHPGDLCNMHCNGPYQFCRSNKKEPHNPGGAGAKQNDARPKKGIDPSNTGTWVPNSPAKGKGVPSVPAGGTLTPTPSSGAKGPILRSSGGRR